MRFLNRLQVRTASHINDNIQALLDCHPINYNTYEEIRARIHSNPELSRQELETASLVFNYLNGLKVWETHEKIGGHGVAAVLKNGSGMTILFRADMDALPVLEQTGLSYASKKTMYDDEDGKIKPVMHACGHDIHVTCLLALAQRLVDMRAHWTGTVILVFQPNEERGGGARSMVEDGLYKKVPVPDVLFAQHVTPAKAGTLGMRPGLTSAASNTLHITMYGRGGHASQPDSAIDPVLMAASTVMRLHTIVSREIDSAKDFAVLTVSAIQAGDAENIIPEKAELKLNLRTHDLGIRDRILHSIERIVIAESEVSGAPSRPVIVPKSAFPLTINDPYLTNRLSETFSGIFGEDFCAHIEASNASEDFPALATSIDRPYCYWNFGGTDPSLFEIAKDQGINIPGNHSAGFAPVMQPTLKIGTDALTVAAMTFLLRN